MIAMATFRPRLLTVFVIISAAFITLTLLSLDLQTYFFTIGKYGSKVHSEGQDSSESISIGAPSLDASFTSGSASQPLDTEAKAAAEAKVKFARTVELLERLNLQDYIPKFM